MRSLSCGLSKLFKHTAWSGRAFRCVPPSSSTPSVVDRFKLIRRLHPSFSLLPPSAFMTMRLLHFQALLVEACYSWPITTRMRPSRALLPSRDPSIHSKWDFAVQVHAIRPSQGSSPHHPLPHPLSPQAPGPPTATAGASSGVATPLAGVGGPTHMQIALAIAFPTQEPYVTDIPMHALGITEVRWRGGTLEN